MRFRFACTIVVAACSALSCGSAGEDREDSDQRDGGGERNGASGRSSQAGSDGSGGSSGSATGAPSSGAPASGGSGTGTSGGPFPGGSYGVAAAGAGAAGGDDFGLAGDGAGGVGDGSPIQEPPEEQCTVPCELALAPSDNLPGKSAVVLYDFETNVATLTSEAAASAASQWVIGFSFQDDPARGNRAWTTGSWWFAFTAPLEYVEGTQGLKQDVELTSQLVNPSTNQILRVIYSFGPESVRVHDIGVPDCDQAVSGACASPSDCAAVEGGMLRARSEMCNASCNGSVDCMARCVSEGAPLSLECSTCYAEFLSCATSGCPNVCPGNGDDCMSCETEHDCHFAFMACSGLDYMPRGTLTWPAPPTAAR